MSDTREWWEVKRTCLATGHVDWSMPYAWGDQEAERMTREDAHAEARRCRAHHEKDPLFGTPGKYKVVVVHVTRRRKGAARAEALAALMSAANEALAEHREECDAEAKAHFAIDWHQRDRERDSEVNDMQLSGRGFQAGAQSVVNALDRLAKEASNG